MMWDATVGSKRIDTFRAPSIDAALAIARNRNGRRYNPRAIYVSNLRHLSAHPPERRHCDPAALRAAASASAALALS